ncbi:MAG: penicillin-binding protein 1A [Legionella sp.]
MKKAGYFLSKGLWALISLIFLILFGIGVLYIYVENQLPNVDSLKSVQLQVPLRIYTQDGLLIQEYGEKRRIPVNYEDIPPTLVHAVLATEDQRFFEHSGVDIFGLLRATVRMIQTGTKSQGGSTITMQVARNFFLNRKKTFLRKFNEIMLAIKIDHELSKEKILELYLNKIYLGNRAYGVGAAAKIYFGKKLKELSLAQLAMIAGLPQAPSTQNPIANPIAAKKRRDHVLERLLDEKYITKDEYQTAIKEALQANYHGANLEIRAPYVAEMIRQSLYDHYGSNAYTKGYKVYTTIKGRLQNAANHVVKENLLAYDRRHGYRGPVSNIKLDHAATIDTMVNSLSKYQPINELEPVLITAVGQKEATALRRNKKYITIPWQGMSWARAALRKGWVGKIPTQAKQIVSKGDIVYVRNNNDNWFLAQVPLAEAAIVALNPQTGAIEALVGGFDFERSKFNRVTQADRQPGSSFKPFIYAAALNKGYTLATLVNDAPIVVDDPSQATPWRPHNDNRKFNGPTRLKEALVHSRNLVSIRILDDIGIDYAIDFIANFGFRKEALPKALSLALGSLSVSPMDLTAAYAVFANGGYRIEPYLIDHITDNDGKMLLQAKPMMVCADCEEKLTTQDHNNAPRVIPEDIAFLMNSALMGVIQEGTAQAARVLNRHDIAGKTGTTNDQVDAWFAGYTPDLVVTAWVGFDTPHPLHEYAARLALPMWIDFMQIALKDLPEHLLKQPKNIIKVNINRNNGLVTKDSDSSSSISEYFRDDEIPSEEDRSASDSLANENFRENLF